MLIEVAACVDAATEHGGTCRTSCVIAQGDLNADTVCCHTSIGTAFSTVHFHLWLGGVVVRTLDWTCNQDIVGSIQSHSTSECNRVQVYHTHTYTHTHIPSRIIWYNVISEVNRHTHMRLIGPFHCPAFRLESEISAVFGGQWLGKEFFFTCHVVSSSLTVLAII